MSHLIAQLLQEASNLSSLGIVPVTALLFSGAATGGGAQTLLKTLTVTNTSGSTVAANSHTPTIGLLFKKGEITTNTYPVLKDNAGTTLSYTYWGKATWSDGSLKFLGVLPRMSATIAGSGTDSLKVYTGGSAQSASSRTLAEVYAASITVHGDGALDNMTAASDWTCDLQAANIVETVDLGDGPAGRVWRFLCNFNNAGSPHGQLVTYFYLMSLQDAAGNLAGFRVLPRVTQPWYNQTTVGVTTRNFRSFTSLTLQYGAGPTTLNPITVSYSAKTFTWSTTGNILNSTAYGYDNGTAVRLTTTGTLPTGLATGTTYWVYTQGANQLIFIDGSMVAAVGNGSSQIVVTGAGSGTHTMTPIPYLCHFGTAWMATTEGKYTYLQGGGSVAAEATLRVSADKTYDRATKVLPPYDLSIGTVTSNSSINWAPQQIGGLTIALGSTGEREDLAPIPSWQVRHFYTQAAVDERYTRIVGLAQGHMTGAIRDYTTKGPINLSQGTYTGMPANVSSSFVWKPGSGTSAGFTAPGNGPQSWSQIFQGPDESHEPNFAFYPYIVTGEPQYMDLLIEAANIALCLYNTGEKNFVVNGTTWYGIGPAGKDAFRTGAWSLRDIVCPAILAPLAAADGTQTSEYLRAQAANQSAYMVAYNNNSQSAWWTANGYWYPQSLANGRGAWHVGYLWSAVNLHANGLEDANALTISTHLSKWPPFIQTLTGNLWCIASYYEIVSSTANTQGFPLISSSIQWGPWINVGNSPGNLSWVSSTSVFTINTTGANGGPFTPADGDRYIFWAVNKPGSNFTIGTLYYSRDTSGSTFKLAATDGGTAITVTADGDLVNYVGSQSCYPQFAVACIPKNPPTTSFLFNGASVSGFGTNMRGNTNWALATGITTTGLSAAGTEFDTRCAATPFTGDPKWAISNAF